MAELKTRIVTDVKTLAEVAQTGVRLGWEARDQMCAERHCSKCSRKDYHAGIRVPQNVKEALGERIAKDLLQALEKQAAKRRYLAGTKPTIYTADGIEYHGPE